MHRADVDVGLAEHRPDPADHPGLVRVAGDQHDPDRLHVEPVRPKARDPRLARGDGPADRDPATARRPVARQRQLGGVGAGVGGLALDHGHAAGLCERRGIHEVHPLGCDVLEEAAQRGRDERRSVVLRQVAGDLQRQRADPTARELGEEAAEDLGERQVRADGLGRLGRDQRGVDRVARAAALEDIEDLGRDLLGDEDLRLRRRGAQVRGQERVRRGKQR